jgi:hypothetical protein
MALVALGVLCVLFYFQRTRPIGWILVGIIVAAMFFGVTIVNTRRQWQPAPTAHVYARTVDLESLLAPRIQVEGHAAVAETSAHPAQPLHPLETAVAVQSEEAVSTGLAKDDAATEEVVESSPSDASDVREIVELDTHERARIEPPAWVAQGPHQEGGSRFAVVVTDPFSEYSLNDADRQLTQLIVIAAAEVASDLVGVYGPHYYPPDAGPNPHWNADTDTRYWYAMEHLNGMGLTPGMIRNEVLRESFVEDLDIGVPSPEMKRVHALLEFDEPFQHTLQERWQQAQAKRRVGVIGVIAAGVLGLLGLVWGVLKFDTVTKGYYTKRLIIVGVLVTIAVIGFFIIATA